MYISSSNREDLISLVSFIRTQHMHVKLEILVRVVHLKLLNFHDSLILRFLMFVLRQSRGMDGVRTYMLIMYERYPEQLHNWIEDLSSHILYGEDTTDETSVGGFSQDELNTLVRDCLPPYKY